MAAVGTPSEGLERLRAAARSGELRALCQRWHVNLLTVFGSAGRGEPGPRDLVGSIILQESEPGIWARASTAAVMERLDTEWLRQLSLDLLAG